MEDIITVFSRKKGWTVTFHEDYVKGFFYRFEYCLVCLDSLHHTSCYCFTSPERNDYVLHKSCSGLPGKIKHTLHPEHFLTVQYYPSFFVCHGCSSVSMGLRYHCKACKFKLDLHCGSKIEGKIWKKKVETYSRYHPHKLRLVCSDPLALFDYCRCLCCRKTYRSPSYTCTTCIREEKPFFIHESCWYSLPQSVQSSFHPEHPLFPQPSRKFSNSPNCEACRHGIPGIGFRCDECCINFDVSCGGRTRPGLRLDIHEHDMHYVNNFADRKKCIV